MRAKADCPRDLDVGGVRFGSSGDSEPLPGGTVGERGGRPIAGGRPPHVELVRRDPAPSPRDGAVPPLVGYLIGKIRIADLTLSMTMVECCQGTSYSSSSSAGSTGSPPSAVRGWSEPVERSLSLHSLLFLRVQPTPLPARLFGCLVRGVPSVAERDGAAPENEPRGQGQSDPPQQHRHAPSHVAHHDTRTPSESSRSPATRPLDLGPMGARHSPRAAPTGAPAHEEARPLGACEITGRECTHREQPDGGSSVAAGLLAPSTVRLPRGGRGAPAPRRRESDRRDERAAGRRREPPGSDSERPAPPRVPETVARRGRRGRGVPRGARGAVALSPVLLLGIPGPRPLRWGHPSARAAHALAPQVRVARHRPDRGRGKPRPSGGTLQPGGPLLGRAGRVRRGGPRRASRTSS